MPKTKTARVVVHEDEKPNTFGWLQLDKKSASELKRLVIKAPIAVATLFYLVERMSRSNSVIVGQAVIAADLGVTARSVSTATALLEQHNFIEATKVGTGTVYSVNTRVFWQGVRGARYAHFNADVYAVELEQKVALDGRPPLVSVPKMHEGERILVGNEEIPPPDQLEMTLP